MNIKIFIPQCYTAIGKKSNQEDSLYPKQGMATEDTRVFLVCDGMGGHEHGEVASACVAETIGKLTIGLPPCSTMEMRNAFEIALEQAYCNLDKLDNTESEKKMGTTLTFLALCTDGALVAHIGDSRVYQLRHGKGILFQTRDHSLVNDLIASGELSEEDARTFSQRNVITRAIQPHQEYPAKATYNVLTDIQKGDVFFMCCDGVIERLDNNDLCTYLLDDVAIDKRLKRIKKECDTRGTRDNNTAYLLEVTDIQGTDEVVKVRSVTKDDALQHHPYEKTRYKYLIPIILLVLLAIGILVFIFLSAPADKGDKQAIQSNLSKTEQVQGTIQRHKY